MKAEKSFEKFKSEILKRAKEQSACASEYRAAAESTNFEQLFTVLKRNFIWGCSHKIIDAELIETVKDVASKNDVFVNTSIIDKGFLFASGSATVEASGSATVMASGSATVMAYDSATVRASGSAFVNIHSTMECKISDNAIVRYRDTNEVMFLDSMKYKAPPKK